MPKGLTQPLPHLTTNAVGEAELGGGRSTAEQWDGDGEEKNEQNN